MILCSSQAAFNFVPIKLNDGLWSEKSSGSSSAVDRGLSLSMARLPFD